MNDIFLSINADILFWILYIYILWVPVDSTGKIGTDKELS